MNGFNVFLGIVFISYYCGEYVICKENGDLDWWKHASLYQIYPRSFKDSDGDGIGDIKGITSKLEHFVDIGVDTIWMTPIFKSPMIDNGYDISDYYDIDPTFGTMADVEEMIAKMKKLGLNFLLDFVPNHTSNKHDWFEKSENRESPYTDFYVWRNSKGKDHNGNQIPPTNWQSLFRGRSAWTWSDKRKQFYYHAFHPEQPDLNFRNPKVVEELEKVLAFWIEKGVNGFRIDAPKFLVEDKYFRDEEIIDGRNYFKRTTDQMESYDILEKIRKFLDDNYTNKYERTILLVPEVYTNTELTMKYYDHDGRKITHFPFNFNLVNFWNHPNSYDVNDRIKRWINNMPKGAVPNWSSDNHDNRRQTNMAGEEISDFLVILLKLLPGVDCTYYGQEIGLIGPKILPNQVVDSIGLYDTRDPERSPMQWDDSRNAGFTDGPETWLPISLDYWERNVKTQKEQDNSHYNVYKKCSNLRKSPVVRNGNLKTYIISEWVYAFTRAYKGEMVVVVSNLGRDATYVDLSRVVPSKKVYLEVVVGSVNSGYKTGEKETDGNRNFLLPPRSTIVCRTIRIN